MYFPAFIFLNSSFPSAVFPRDYVPIINSQSLQQMPLLPIPIEKLSEGHLRIMGNEPNHGEREQEPSERSEADNERQAETRPKRKYRKRRNFLAKFEC
jgi:hypothetical protein